MVHVPDQDHTTAYYALLAAGMGQAGETLETRKSRAVWRRAALASIAVNGVLFAALAWAVVS